MPFGNSFIGNNDYLASLQAARGAKDPYDQAGEKAAGVGQGAEKKYIQAGKDAQGFLGPAANQAVGNAAQLNKNSAIEDYYRQLQASGSAYYNNARRESMGNLSQLYAAQGAFGSGANLAANAKAQATLAGQEEQFMGGLANQATQAQQGRLGEAYNQLFGAGKGLADYGFQAAGQGTQAWTEGQYQQISAAMAKIHRGEQLSDQDRQFVYGLISNLIGGGAKAAGAAAGGGP